MRWSQKIALEIKADDENALNLKQSLALMKAILESSNDGILIVGNDRNLIDYNSKFCQIGGFTAAYLDKQEHETNILTHIKAQLIDPLNFLIIIEELYNSPERVGIDLLYFKNGRVYERYSYPYKFMNKSIGRIWHFRDVTMRCDLENRLSYQLTHDVLTGLPSRLLLFSRMRQLIIDSDKNRTSFALLFIDIDRFKLINDSLGHTLGDELLREIGKRLKTLVDEETALARIGSDEFALLIPETADEKALIKVAGELLKAINQPFQVGNRDITVSASIGLTVYPADGKTVDILLRNADSAAHHAKKLGHRSYQFYRATMNVESMALLDLENQLRRALLNNEFFLTYQPQFALVNKEMIGVEALIRWHHPEKGVVSPIDFVPFIESSEIIIPLGEWVLREVCQQNKSWQDAGLPLFPVAANVSANQLKQHDFVQKVENILLETGLLPQYLELELSENIIVSNPDIVTTINQLKKLGVQISLDDFGTGYSSLGCLKKLPLNRLKIDKSFIQHIQTNQNDFEIVRAIIAIASSLNLQVIAEGVESEGQLDLLLAEKCHSIQGFYLSTPLLPAELEVFLRKK